MGGLFLALLRSCHIGPVTAQTLPTVFPPLCGTGSCRRARRDSGRRGRSCSCRSGCSRCCCSSCSGCSCSGCSCSGSSCSGCSGDCSCSTHRCCCGGGHGSGLRREHGAAPWRLVFWWLVLVDAWHVGTVGK